MTACVSSGERKLDQAAKEAGRQAAGINLPPWPAYCTEPMPKVFPKLDEPVWGTQERWEITRDNENKRIEWCAQHYAQTKAQFQTPARPEP